MQDSRQLDARTASLVSAISKPRLGPYLSVANNGIRDALRLYQWNIDLSGAVYEALHVFEVFLRNRIDRQLSTWNAGQTDPATGEPHSTDWLVDPARLLRRLVGPNITKATEQARFALRGPRHRARVVGHPDIVAQLTFGTWRFLLPDRDPGRQRLWADSIHAAFPHLPSEPATLVSKVDGIYRLRNRIAHLEPLLRSAMVRNEVNDIRWVLAAMDPNLEEWFTSRQRVTNLLRQRPL